MIPVQCSSFSFEGTQLEAGQFNLLGSCVTVKILVNEINVYSCELALDTVASHKSALPLETVLYLSKCVHVHLIC